LALTSYNHGIGGMQRAKDLYGHDFMRIVNDYEHRYFGFASRNFYAEFLAARDVANHPDRFFPEGLRYEPPLNWDRIVLTYPMPVSELALRYNVDRGSLASMNAAWTSAARRGRVAIPAGTEVWLPPGTVQRVAQLGHLTDQALAVSSKIPASRKSSGRSLQSF
jgi:membrane-bound lytic murein transglycosylase D